MKQCLISDLKKGDLFTFKDFTCVADFNESKFKVRGHYDRSSRTYAYYSYSDVNDEHFARPSRKVYTF